MTFTKDHFAQVFQFLTHNLITTVVLILIAIIFSAIRWYAITLIVLITYAYPLLSNHSYYPWEKHLRRNHHFHEKKEKSKDKQEKKYSQKLNLNKDKIIVSGLIIVIIILISLIIFFIVSTKSTNTTHSSAQSTTVQKSSSEKKISSSNKKRISATQQHTQQLSPTNMDDKLKAAAAYYYASEHHQKMFEFKMAIQQNGLSIGNDVSAEYQKGDNPVSLMPLNAGSGAVPFYTTDNDNVYFYVPSALPPEAIGEDNDDSDQPVLTTTWQEICDLVNQNGAYEQVKKVADNSETTGD